MPTHLKTPCEYMVLWGSPASLREAEEGGESAKDHEVKWTA